MQNNNKISQLSFLIGAALTAATMNATAVEMSASSLQQETNTGTPVMAPTSPSPVLGNYPLVIKNPAEQAFQNIISNQSSYGSVGNEKFKVRRQWTDELGKSHTHFDQTINGIKVYGTSMIMHTNSPINTFNASNSASSVYKVTGKLATNSLPSFSVMNNASALSNDSAQALVAAESVGDVLNIPELAYVYLPLSEETKLAYRLEVSWDNGGEDFGRDFIYFDVNTSEILAREPQVHSAKNWRTYTLNGGSANSAPGTLLCTNTQSCGSNAAAQRAHDGASKVYDYYQSKFGRDSLDNNGMTLVSSVDLGVVNAYWTGSQMMYGQASGGMNDFTSDFDIIGHELTHGVTDKTANLIYANASGALNEAWSDILGISAEAYRNGTTSSSWLLGDGLYNTQGQALRYMDNPTQDNYSKDWYPERIPFVSNPSNSNDQGGVHGNSGIANLAYVLLVDGGTHPRNKSTAQVPSIGMAKAEKIFYRALVTYMNQNTNFAGARAATAQAAQDLYGATEKTAVETAWCAVGVGACPTTGTPPTGNVLTNGVAATNLSASTNADVVYTMEVPSGATDISFLTTGGSGDADMYVKFGSAPTDSSYDCRPYKGGNVESCAGTSTGGTYYVRVKAYSAFSGVSLTGSFTEAATGNPALNGSESNVAVSKGQWKRFTQVLPAGYADLTISLSGGSGDADLYIRRGVQSTASAYDCRPYKNGNNESCSFTNPAAGTWYIDIFGYSTASGMTLTLQANP
ncbi:M4 family metallopeptidase [Colwellia sp. BRX8-8]|nr:M4 family metallopeptidase [Colwellia sp. BRX8-8]